MNITDMIDIMDIIGIAHEFCISDIIDIVERPWKQPYREAFETYLKEIYDDESE